MTELGCIKKSGIKFYPNSLESGFVAAIDYNNEHLNAGNKLSRYVLRLFCGTHGDYGAQISNMILPLKIFLERTYSSVNIQGISYSYRFSAYKYFIDDIRSLSELIKLKILKLAGKTIYINKLKTPGRLIYSDIYAGVSKISPLFSSVETVVQLPCLKISENLTNSYMYKFKNFSSFILRNSIFDFFLADHYSRASVTLNMHYSKSFYSSDFKFLYNFSD